MRKCIKCLQKKELSEFHKLCDGHQSTCKTCRKAYYKTRYENKKKHILKVNSEYRHTPNGRMTMAKGIQRFREKYPEKRRAWIITANALSSGQLKKHPCEVCGKKKAEAHHDDYDKPLQVRWLCKKHHIEVHKQLKNKNYVTL